MPPEEALCGEFNSLQLLAAAPAARGQVPASPTLSREERYQTLRAFYDVHDPMRLDSKIRSTLAVYESDAQWDALLQKIEGKYRAKVEVVRAGAARRSPRSPQATAASRRAPLAGRQTGAAGRRSPLTDRNGLNHLERSPHSNPLPAPAPERLHTTFVCAEPLQLEKAVAQVHVPISCTYKYQEKPSTSYASLSAYQMQLLELKGPRVEVDRLKADLDRAVQAIREEARGKALSQPRAGRAAWEDRPATTTAALSGSWHQEIVLVPASKQDMIMAVTGEHSCNLPAGLYVTRGEDSDGMITIRISSAEKALVDNVKALLESVAWEEDAPRTEEAEPPEVQAGADDGAARPVQQPALVAVADFIATLSESLELTVTQQRRVEELFKAAVDAVRGLDFADILSDQLQRVEFTEEGFFRWQAKPSAADLKPVGEVCRRLASVTTFEEAWSAVDTSPQQVPRAWEPEPEPEPEVQLGLEPEPEPEPQPEREREPEPEPEPEPEQQPAQPERHAAEPTLVAVADCCAAIEADPVPLATCTRLQNLLREALEKCAFADLLQDPLERAGVQGSDKYVFVWEHKTDAATLRHLGEVCGKLALAKTWDEAFQMMQPEVQPEVQPELGPAPTPVQERQPEPARGSEQEVEPK
eukprot:COSAG04_NODE_813_length_10099_cov_2.722600_3_plen_641_part_01